MWPKRLVSTVATLGLTSSLFLTGPVSPVAAEPVAAPPAGLTFIHTGSESILDAAARLAAKDPEFARSARPLAQQWQRQISQGRVVKGISDKPMTRQRSLTLSRLAAGSVSAKAVVSTDPNTYPVRGQSGGDTSYWTGLVAAVYAAYCGGSGCEDTDKLTIRSTVNPGTKTSKVTSTISYFPNTGAIRNWYVRVFAVCSGSICGADKYTKPAAGGHTYYISSSSDRHGKVLTVAVGLEGYANNWAYDGSKTKDCKGSTKSTDNRCWYQWDKA